MKRREFVLSAMTVAVGAAVGTAVSRTGPEATLTYRPNWFGWTKADPNDTEPQPGDLWLKPVNGRQVLHIYRRGELFNYWEAVQTRHE